MCYSTSAFCHTIRRSMQLHFDPGKIAVMIWSGSHIHRSALSSAAQNANRAPPSFFFGDAEVRRPGPTTIQCLAFEPLHLHQDFPNCSLTSSISAFNSVPHNPTPLTPFRHLRCPLCFSQASAQSASHL